LLGFFDPAVALRYTAGYAHLAPSGAKDNILLQIHYVIEDYTEAGKAIGFALEQSLHVVALPCSALRISKRLQHIMRNMS
jgi:hypothetical protein